MFARNGGGNGNGNDHGSNGEINNGSITKSVDRIMASQLFQEEIDIR